MWWQGRGLQAVECLGKQRNVTCHRQKKKSVLAESGKQEILARMQKGNESEGLE